MIEIITKEIEPILKSNNCYLYDIVYERSEGEWYLRIFIDMTDKPLDMETCVTVSEAVSEKLDSLDVIKDEYYLEVSSPGAEKPLKTFAHVQQSIGKYVYMKFVNPVGGKVDVEGTLLSIDGEEIEFEFKVKNIKKTIKTSYSNIKEARLAIRF